MSYIGVKPKTAYDSVRKDRFTSTTGTTVTLSYAVSSVNDILVWVNGVKQDYTNYSVSSTTLTLGGTLVSSDIVEVAYLGRTYGTVSPAVNSVTNDMLVGSIANSKLATDPLNASNLASGTVPTARLGSGTASSSTVLYGDNTFKAEPSGGFVRVGGATVSSAVSSIAVDNVFSTTYDVYRIVGQLSPSTAGADSYIRFRNGGSDTTDNSYQTVGNMNNQGNGTNTQSPPSTGGWGLTYIPFMNGAITSDTTIPNFDFLFFNPMSTDRNKSLLGHSGFYRTNNTYNYNYFAAYLNDGGTNSFEGITFFPSGGNFDKGYIDVYGMVKS